MGAAEQVEAVSKRATAEFAVQSGLLSMHAAWEQAPLAVTFDGEDLVVTNLPELQVRCPGLPGLVWCTWLGLSAFVFSQNGKALRIKHPAMPSCAHHHQVCRQYHGLEACPSAISIRCFCFCFGWCLPGRDA